MAAANSEHLTSVAPVHQAGEVVGDDLLGDGGLEGAARCRRPRRSSPRCSNMSTPESSTEPGLTLSWPAYLGAVPWVASKMPWPVT